jgi:hypothetical protein
MTTLCWFIWTTDGEKGNDFDQQAKVRVLWSDESNCKNNLFGSYGIRFVRRPDGERMNVRYILPTVKHGGGNFKVWGCFLPDGV